MKAWEFFTLLWLSIFALAVSVSTVLVARSQRQIQRQLQFRQIQLNTGILGRRGQELSSGILQEMGAVAQNNPAMRRLLARHGYTVTVTPAPGPSEPERIMPSPEPEE